MKIYHYEKEKKLTTHEKYVAKFLMTTLPGQLNTSHGKKKRIWSQTVEPAKKGDKHYKSNYGPLIILPILSKFYEKCLYKQIENYMENILSNFQ